ncbi:SDR family oxidoreductase [Aliidongia dinghuensis]|nr:SDR family oxidoreductase [Aliidongia dinghuensis]
MTKRLAGKIAMITGGASGLGESQARRFAHEGAQVVVCDVNEAKGMAVAQDIGAQFLLLDVRSESAFRAAIEATVSQWGRFDILVNNAGVARVGTPETIEEADYRLVMSVCVDGTVFGCKHAIPAMVASGGGAIVNIASIASMRGIPYAAGYSAAKGAVEAYTRSVAAHCKLNNLNVRCNSVHPGGFATPMLGKTIEDLRKNANSTGQLQNRAANMLGDPVEVANLVLFLASDEAKWINGQRFVIDNGDTIAVPSGK